MDFINEIILFYLSFSTLNESMCAISNNNCSCRNRVTKVKKSVAHKRAVQNCTVLLCEQMIVMIPFLLPCYGIVVLYTSSWFIMYALNTYKWAIRINTSDKFVARCEILDLAFHTFNGDSVAKVLICKGRSGDSFVFAKCIWILWYHR